MIYKLTFTRDAEKILAKYKKSNPRFFKKLRDLLHDLEEHPYTGIGHPEPLVGGNNITYSRRIGKSDRIIYNIYDDAIMVLVLTIEGHYGDK